MLYDGGYNAWIRPLMCTAFIENLNIPTKNVRFTLFHSI